MITQSDVVSRSTKETINPSQIIEELKTLRRDIASIPALSSLLEIVNNSLLSLLDPSGKTDSSNSIVASSKLKRKKLRKFCCNRGIARNDQHFSLKWYCVPVEVTNFVKQDLEEHKRQRELELRPLLEELKLQKSLNIWTKKEIQFYPGVPKLSSSSQDGYVITASNEHSSYARHYAFDGNPSTRWRTTDNVGEAWLQIKLPRETAFNAVQIKPDNLGQAPSIFRIDASLDEKQWETLDVESTTWGDGTQVKEFVFSHIKPFLYYRFCGVKSPDNVFSLRGFGLGYGVIRYKRTSVVPQLQSESDTLPDGLYKLSSNPTRSCNNVRNLFDGKQDTFFTLPDATGGHVQIELPHATFVNVFSVGARNDSLCVAAPRDYVLFGSQTGTDWTSLFTLLAVNHLLQERFEDIS